MKERWSSCADKGKLKKGPWTFEEDVRLLRSIRIHGEGRWSALAKAAGLQRCGKSCRLRWVNYLRPDLKRGNITKEEEQMIIELHSRWGNRWSLIAEKMPGRTDNEIKNYWRCHLKKKLQPSEPAAATAKQEHSSQRGIVNSLSKVPQGHHPSVLEEENGGNMLSSSFTRQGNNNGFDVCSVEVPCRPQTGVEAHHHHHHHLGNMQHLDSLQYPANLGSRVETVQQGMVMGSSSSSNSTHPVPGILCRLTSEIPLTEEIEIEIQQQHHGEGAGACEQRTLNTCLDELYPIHNCDLDFDMGCETMNLMLWNNLLHDTNNNPVLNTNTSIPSSFAPLQP